LQAKRLPGLFLAGQTTAPPAMKKLAAQGIVAGLNAACPPAAASRSVSTVPTAISASMIDDLVTRGSPSRTACLSSRAEYRDAGPTMPDQRLTDKGIALGS